MNYQKELDIIINQLEQIESTPKLLIHSCCGPCSSYVLEYLSKYFEITIFYYNPNIHPKEEFVRRAKEQETLIDSMQLFSKVKFLLGEYQPKEYYDRIKGLEQEPEGGLRCFECYELRLREAAKLAKERTFDYFTTTLTISPHKNAEKLNEIGEALSKEYQIAFLPSDFKKKNGYKRSIELSKEYDLYRQDYCGCVFSKKEAELRREQQVVNQSDN